MSQDNSIPALAINLADIAAHPAEAMAALIEVVQFQGGEIAKLQENLGIQAGLIAKLKAQLTIEPTVSQANRGEILRALLAANGGKMFAKDARQRMSLDKSVFSRLLITMKAYIEVRPFQADRRRDLLILKSDNG